MLEWIKNKVANIWPKCKKKIFFHTVPKSPTQRGFMAIIRIQEINNLTLGHLEGILQNIKLLLQPTSGFIYAEINKCNVSKSGNLALHLCAKGWIVTSSVLIQPSCCEDQIHSIHLYYLLLNLTTLPIIEYAVHCMNM